MAFYDTTTQDYPRIPSYMILDEEGRKRAPLGFATFNDPESFYEWSEDNLKEVENGIIHQADTIEEIATKIEVDPQVLATTVSSWNQMCEMGEDPDFARPGGTMMPLRTPPYIYAPLWPVVSNTHGGPRHDVQQRAINVWGQPGTPSLRCRGAGRRIWPPVPVLGQLQRVLHRRLDSRPPRRHSGALGPDLLASPTG